MSANTRTTSVLPLLRGPVRIASHDCETQSPRDSRAASCIFKIRRWRESDAPLFLEVVKCPNWTCVGDIVQGGASPSDVETVQNVLSKIAHARIRSCSVLKR